VSWLALALLGCVPKGRYEITQVQLEATRTAFSARTAQCVQDATAADQREVELQAELASRQAQLDELVARAEIATEDLSQVERERALLLDELAGLRAELDALQASLAKKGKPPPAVIPGPIESMARDELLAKLAAQDRAALEQDRVDAAKRNTREAFADLAASGKVEVEDDRDAVLVRIPTRLLFQEGFTTLSPRGEALMGEVAAALARIPGRIVTVEGHTDDRKVHTAEFPSNWERGFSHALAVLRALTGAEQALDERFSAASFAETRPLVPNDSPEGRERNERIELRIVLDPALASRFSPTPPPDPTPDGAPDPADPPAP
jgi:chemotaxis protein MotB